MAEMIAVRPTSKGMALAHPVSGPLPDDGGEWPNDQFTARRLLDRDIRRLTEKELAAVADARAEALRAEEAAQAEAREAAKKAKTDAATAEPEPVPVVAASPDDAPSPTATGVVNAASVPSAVTAPRVPRR